VKISTAISAATSPIAAGRIPAAMHEDALRAFHVNPFASGVPSVG
jgi:hypothetical protein